MPQYVRTADPLERIARLEERIASLEKAGGTETDEVPFYPTLFTSMAFSDYTTFATQWETTITPRTASLSLGLVFIGDLVGTTNTGGEWRVLFASTIVMSGTVPPTYTYQFPQAVLDLTPYLAAQILTIQIQTRRTSGATTGGKFGGGGSIGCAPRFARLI